MKLSSGYRIEAAWHGTERWNATYSSDDRKEAFREWRHVVRKRNKARAEKELVDFKVRLISVLRGNVMVLDRD